MTLRQLRHSRPLRLWFGLLVVLAFGLKALLPTGYMLAATDGQLRLVICPGATHHGAGAHDAHAAHDPHAAHGATAEQCPFALAGGAGLLAADHTLAEPYFIVLPAARPAAVTSVPSAPPPRHNAPRGPPVLA